MPDIDTKTLVKLTIDGVPVEVEPGSTILPAAERAGVFIPHYCYHPDLSLAGNCRICQVEVEGMPRPVVSCMTPVKEGMVVRTDTEKVKKAVRGDLEFLLLNHPVDCPICDQAGECSLQDFYMKVGLHASRLPLVDKVRKRKVLPLGPTIVLDSERCVMCSRCIRFSDEVSKTHQFGFFNRGASMEIGTFRDRALEDPYSGCYADVCPVGALTSADFRFNSRVWFLERTESVCPECSTGCSIRIDHKGGSIYRYVPRRNPEVNLSWMCDVGRFSYKQVMAPTRLDRPRLAGKDGAGVPEALERVVSELQRVRRDEGCMAGLATPRASCEALYLFRRLMVDVLGTPHIDFRVDPQTALVAEREDDVLRRQDHNPNTRGAELLGVIPAAEGWPLQRILEAAAEGRLDALYLLGPELLTRWPDQELVRNALEGARFTVLHDTEEREEHALFDVVLPVAAFAEMDGTTVNYDWRLQRFFKAIDPPGEAQSGVALLAAILNQLDRAEVPAAADEVFAHMATANPGLEGLGFVRVGPMGVKLESVEVMSTA